VKTRRGTDEQFLSCSGWRKKEPLCDYTAPMPIGIGARSATTATSSRSAPMKGRRPFWGCSNYATDLKCDFRLFQPPVKEACPQCNAAFLVQAGGKTRPVLKCVTEGCGFERALVGADGGDGDGDGEEAPAPKFRVGAKKASKKGASEASA
jgi:ssDNA-binding Zn-finger/Zn-ribbon topoisomerase 1